jgi:predicted nucleic acid-binding protein
MMNIILDMNVLMSALIKDSYTRELIVKATKAHHKHWVPEVAFKKLVKYRMYISRRKGCDPADVDSLLEELMKYVSILPGAKIESNVQRAKKVMGHIDSENSVFVACALSIPSSVIWSNDRHFREQKLVKVYTTDEMRGLL